MKKDNVLILGDCLEKMKHIPDKSIDMILYYETFREDVISDIDRWEYEER